MYNNLVKNSNNIKSILGISFVEGPKVEIVTPIKSEYYIEFINSDTNQIVHASNIKNNHWTKCSYQYFINWHIKVYQKQESNLVLIEEDYFNCKDKTVYIALDSKALGDTLAWIPYVEEFRKTYNSKVICSTFHNKLFEQIYPEIEFINPGEPANNLYAMYKIGWYYNEDESLNYFMHPSEIKTQPLQKTATDILGLDFKEIIPNINKNLYKTKKQIAIGFHSTAQAKYWNNPKGWQEVVDYCIDKGYEVIMLSKEGDTYMGNNHPKGIKYLDSYDMENTIKTLCESKVFIGISSGLSWLSWALNIPTMIISGFSYGYTEPESCYRIESPEGICSGCFNTHKLDPGDWNWCPKHKNTERQFECSKSITSNQVINKLKRLII
jgi:hypothetical protein